MSIKGGKMPYGNTVEKSGCELDKVGYKKTKSTRINLRKNRPREVELEIREEF
jgi:hypothetical protein